MKCLLETTGLALASQGFAATASLPAEVATSTIASLQGKSLVSVDQFK
jgi:hypothetical protein